MEFKIEIRNIDKITQALRQYPTIAEQNLQKAIDATGAVLAKNTLKNDPVPWRTGNLLQTFRAHKSKLKISWGPTAYYAPYVEFGRGPVYPINAKALSWGASEGGGYVTSRSGRRYYKGGTTSRIFAKYSRAAKAKPFMGQIVEKATPEINHIFEQAIALITQEIARGK